MKRFIVVTAPSAPSVGSPNFAERELLCGPHFAELSRIKELDLSSTERKKQREKNNFYYVNKSVYVTPTVCENCALLTFRCFTRGVFEKRNSVNVKHTSALLGEIEIIGRVESFDCVIAYF